MSGFVEGPRLNTVPDRPYYGSYYKATDSTAAALRDGKECKNSSFTKKDMVSEIRNSSFTKKDMVSELRKQALTSNIRRLKRNIRQHEKQRKVILLELQQLKHPLSDNMIKKQGNLEMLL